MAPSISQTPFANVYPPDHPRDMLTMSNTPVNTTDSTALPSLAIVVIGRNEGDRLKNSLDSLRGLSAPIVYVDSGSTDGSAQLAQGLGCAVINLDMRERFTAARARNEGFAVAQSIVPNLKFVQFVDGDCELTPDWVSHSIRFLEANPDVAVTFGRLRERHPDASIYNQFCDISWDGPPGETLACGGIAMMRAEAFREAKGFLVNLIAGEEPELCIRLRKDGWRIFRLKQQMAWHDASMTHFSQWWGRSVRTGFAYAEGVAMHGAPPERHWVRESQSAWFWGLGLPALSIIMALAMGPWGWLPLAIYPLQTLRIYLRVRNSLPKASAYAFFLVLGKFPEVYGQIKYWLARLQGRHISIIEYK